MKQLLGVTKERNEGSRPKSRFKSDKCQIRVRFLPLCQFQRW